MKHIVDLSDERFRRCIKHAPTGIGKHTTSGVLVTFQKKPVDEELQVRIYNKHGDWIDTVCVTRKENWDVL